MQNILKFLSSCSDNFPYLNSSFRELRMKIIEYVKPADISLERYSLRIHTGRNSPNLHINFFTPSNSNYVWGKLPKLSWLQYSFCLNGNDKRHYSLILTTPDLMLKLSKYNCLKVCLPRSDCDLSSITKQRRISLICSF